MKMETVMDEYETLVIFRKCKRYGNVLAIFPEEAGTKAWFKDCLAYMGNGQSGVFDLDKIDGTSSPHKKEYQALYDELVWLGYRLKLIKRVQVSHMAKRKTEVENRNGQ